MNGGPRRAHLIGICGTGMGALAGLLKASGSIVSGSDAHTPQEVGRSTMLLEDFMDAEGLRRVIRQAVPHNRLSGWGVHFASSKAKELKRGKPSNK